MKNYILFILLCFSLSTTYGQELSVTSHFVVEDGLKQNTITQLIQDDSGRMWIGSTGGLQYYNGYEFIDFKGIENRVMGFKIKDGFLYCITIKTLSKIKLSTLEMVQHSFDKTDYYYMFFDESFINVIINGTKIVKKFDYELNVIYDYKNKEIVIAEKKIILGDLEIKLLGYQSKSLIV